MAESKLAALSMDFAVKVLRLCDSIKGHYSLVSQLERSATSIGAGLPAGSGRAAAGLRRFAVRGSCFPMN